jgi:hypothetical protein
MHQQQQQQQQEECHSVKCKCSFWLAGESFQLFPLGCIKDAETFSQDAPDAN